MPLPYLFSGFILPLGEPINTDPQEIKKRYDFYPQIKYNGYIVRDKTFALVRYLIVIR